MERPLILIVDDEKNIRLTLKEALGPDYQTVLASDGAEAVRIVQDQTPALVLLDLRLPDGDGLDVLRRIEEDHPEIPVIIITAHGSVETALEAMDAGAHSFIEKPFAPGHIRLIVAHALDPDVQAEKRAALYEEYMGKGMDSLREKQIDAAMEHTRRAIAVDASRPEAFNLLGVLTQLRTGLREARRLYNMALALEPSFEPAQRNRDNLSKSPPHREMGKYWIE